LQSGVHDLEQAEAKQIIRAIQDFSPRNHNEKTPHRGVSTIPIRLSAPHPLTAPHPFIRC
jgi:hypothetical protein